MAVSIVTGFSQRASNPGLAVTITPGDAVINGSVVRFPLAAISLPANTLSYIYLNFSTGTIQSSTVGFLTGAWPICTAQTDNLNCIAINDLRPDAFSGSSTAAITWDTISSGLNNLTLSNAGFTTTFNQTSAVVWLWANTTIASAITLNASPLHEFAANYWNGAASAQDLWTIGSSLTAGTNGVSTLSLLHSGSTGVAKVSVPNLLIKGDTTSSYNLEVHAGNASPFVAGFFNDTFSTTNPGIRYYVDNTGAFFMSPGTATQTLSFGTSSYNVAALQIATDNVFVQNVLRVTGGNFQLNSDSNLSRLGAASLALGNGTAGDFTGSLKLNSVTEASANGATWTQGQASELLTLSTIGLTTDTVGNLLPANAIIESVVCRVTTTITTTTNWAVGDATISNRFASANTTLVSGTTSVGLNQCDLTGTSGPKQVAAAKVRITCTGANPGAGVIRITVFYRQFVAPTS